MPERRRWWHGPDWSSTVAGAVFVGAGAVALVTGRDGFVDALVWVWSSVVLGLGVALLLPRGRGREEGGEDAEPALGGEDGPGDEVGAERREDGEVQQAGGGHDG